MDKIRAFIEKNHSLLLVLMQTVFSVAIAAGAIFYAYANVVIYRLWKIVLIGIDFAVSCGVLFALTYYERHPDRKAIYLAIPFLLGGGVLIGLFFGVQAIFARHFNPTVCSYIGIAVVLAFDLACVIAQDVFATKRTRKFFLWATAALALAIYVGTLALSFLTMPHGWLFKSFSRDSHTFASATADAYEITLADRQAGQAWMDRHLTGGDFDPAFDFSLGGKSFRENRSDWTIENAVLAENAGDLTFARTLRNEAAGVEVLLSGAYYDETATVEWKLTATNIGSANSAVLTDFRPLDAALDIPSATLYFSGGSAERNDDFALYSRQMISRTYTFDTVKGRTSMLYLPFFNVVGAEKGATIGIGWSGNWTADFSGKDKVSVRVGQTDLEGYLEPSESVRTPLVSLCLYGGGNALKGFNNFRADVKRGLPNGYKDGTANSFMFFAGAAGQDDTTRANAAGTTAFIAELQRTGAIAYLDYAWYDASWYDTAGTDDWRATVGDWVVDEVKYPDGLDAVSDELAAVSAGMLLWYEPERVPKSCHLASETLAAGNQRWLLSAEGKEEYLWDMGNDEARAFMTARILASLQENGVSYYRQDFNIDPEKYWQEADAAYYGGRKGFAENHYVVGEYLFLDAILEAGYLIDNCASGGRRIDLEMCRRSVPLWRSDYACKTDITDLAEAVQYEQYGLAMWLPYSAITDQWATGEYALRSLLGGCVMVAGDLMFTIGEDFVRFFAEYEQIKEYFSENYYPLTDCTMRSNFVAMQYGTADRGVIVLYSRANSKGEKNVVMNGLLKDANYMLTTIEGQAVALKKGSELLWDGFSFMVREKTAYIILYEKD